MMSVKKKNLPEFIQKSSLFKDNKKILIPETLNIEKIKVKNINDYKKLFETIEFFDLEMDEELIYYQENNKEEVLSYLYLDKINNKNIIDNIENLENEFIINFELGHNFIIENGTLSDTKKFWYNNNTSLNLVNLDLYFYYKNGFININKINPFNTNYINTLNFVEEFLILKKNETIKLEGLNNNIILEDINGDIYLNYKFSKNSNFKLYAEKNSHDYKMIINQFMELKKSLDKIKIIVENGGFFFFNYNNYFHTDEFFNNEEVRFFLVINKVLFSDIDIKKFKNLKKINKYIIKEEDYLKNYCRFNASYIDTN